MTDYKKTIEQSTHFGCFFLYKNLRKRGTMMNDFKKRLAKLIDVKTIITLSLLFAFINSVLNGKVDGNELVNMFQMVVCFYFGTQAQKKADEQG